MSARAAKDAKRKRLATDLAIGGLVLAIVWGWGSMVIPMTQVVAKMLGQMGVRVIPYPVWLMWAGDAVVALLCGAAIVLARRQRTPAWPLALAGLIVMLLGACFQAYVASRFAEFAQTI